MLERLGKRCQVLVHFRKDARAPNKVYCSRPNRGRKEPGRKGGARPGPGRGGRGGGRRLAVRQADMRDWKTGLGRREPAQNGEAGQRDEALFLGSRGSPASAAVLRGPLPSPAGSPRLLQSLHSPVPRKAVRVASEWCFRFPFPVPTPGSSCGARPLARPWPRSGSSLKPKPR